MHGQSDRMRFNWCIVDCGQAHRPALRRGCSGMTPPAISEACDAEQSAAKQDQAGGLGNWREATKTLNSGDIRPPCWVLIGILKCPCAVTHSSDCVSYISLGRRIIRKRSVV